MLSFLFWSIHTNGQLQVWRHINTDGMANKNVMCMTADASGMLYLGTQGGPELYDGRRFIALTIPDYIQNGINPFVNQLCWGRGGILWINTRSHILTYNPANGAMKVVYKEPSSLNINTMELDTVRQRLYLVRNDGITSCKVSDTGLTPVKKYDFATVNETAIDSDGRIYAVAKDKKNVFMIDGNMLSTVYADSFIKDIAFLPKHNALVLMTATGLVKIDAKTRKTELLPVKPVWPYRQSRTRLTALADDELMIHQGSSTLLLHNIYDTLAIEFMNDEKNQVSIQLNYVIYAFSDSRKNLWVSEDGVSISVLPANSRHTRFVSAKMAGGARLWKSYHDSVNKQVLTSTENGAVATYYECNRVSYKTGIRPASEKKFFEFLYCTPWNKEELLLGTNGAGTWLFNMKTYQFSPFAAINKYRKEWVCWGGQRIDERKIMLHGMDGTFLYTRQDGKVTELLTDSASRIFNEGNPGKPEIISSYIDKDRQIWYGSNYGILVVDSTQKFLKMYGKNKNARKDGLSNTVVMDITQAADGDMYVATMGSGAFHLTKADTFESIPLAGNPNSISCLAALDKEYLIITTSNGLCLYNTRTRKSKLINAGYGMPIGDFNQGALILDGRFVMASGAKGFVIIDRDKILKSFHDTAKLVVMNGMLAVDQFTLKKGEQSLNFDVCIPGYAGTANWSVRYKLDGLDEDWKYMAKAEWHIRYNSIKPGNYTLLIEATDEQNVVWAAPVSVKITALPYFWQTMWFRILLTLVGLVLLVIVVRFFSQLQLRWKLKKLEDEQKVARERIRISRELHDNVGSQLTYLISGLESSDILLERQDTEKLKNKIGKMQLSARDSMQQLRDSIWALNHESVQASVLLSRFQSWLTNIMEVQPNISYEIRSEITTDHTLDPIKSLNIFRIMQEAVHNVLKHSKASHLTITFSGNINNLLLVIEDNGVGFDMAVSNGNGRKTMASRAEEAGATFILMSSPGKGTTVRVSIAL
jgi:signal transduction histidine kinase